jgi:DMSO reductase anchor subunit
VAGLAGALLSLVTVYCTAMIYASLKSIHRWANGLVPPAYLVLGLATGALLMSFLTHVFWVSAAAIDGAALAAILLAGLAKGAYWNDIARSRSASNTSTATGLGKPGLVRLLEAPHTESNYLLQEMGYRIARKHAARLRVIVWAALFAVPLALLSVVLLAGAIVPATLLLATASLSAAIGVLAERWLFFAEAKHTVTLYYGQETA